MPPPLEEWELYLITQVYFRFKKEKVEKKKSGFFLWGGGGRVEPPSFGNFS